MVINLRVRTRYRPRPSTFRYQRYTRSTGLPTGAAVDQSDVNLKEFYEEIRDEFPSRPTKVNFVNHDRAVVHVKNCGRYKENSTQDVEYTSAQNYAPLCTALQALGLIPWFSLSDATSTSLPPSNSVWSAEILSMTAGWDPFPVGTSAANFVLELNELKGPISVARNVLGLGARAGSIAARTRRIGRYLRRKYGRQATISSMPLSYYYGWKPFVADIQAFSAACEQVEKQIAHLNKIRGRLVTLGSSRSKDSTDLGIANQTPPNTSTNAGSWLRRDKLTYELKLGCKVLHDLDGLESWQGQVAGFTGYLGLNRIPWVAWNAVKYSFVADYFFNFGDRLKQIQFPLLPGSYKLSSVYSALSAQATYTCCMSQWGGSILSFGTGDARRYRRFSGLPVQGFTTSPTQLQLALIAALTHNTVTR